MKFIVVVNSFPIRQFALVFDYKIVEIATSNTYDLLKTSLCLHLFVQVSIHIYPPAHKSGFVDLPNGVCNLVIKMDILLLVLFDTTVNYMCREASMLLSRLSFLQIGLAYSIVIS